MSTNLPIRILRPLHRQCFFQRAPLRHFSTTITLQKKATKTSTASPSPHALQAEAFNDSGNLPDDLGILSGTFIRPPFPKLPPVKNLKEWTQYEWEYIKARFQGLYSLYQYRRINNGSPYFKIHLFPWSKRKELVPMAKIKYRHIYSWFAKKDEKRLSEICLSGVARELRKRLELRPTNLEMQWKIIPNEDSVKAKVISNRTQELNLPGRPRTAIRQIVVRIKTRQRLQAKRISVPAPSVLPKTRKRALVWTPDGKELEKRGEKEAVVAAPTEEDVTEYLVLQKMVLEGEETKEWKVWGFVSETTLESIKEDEKFRKEVLAFQV